jgi:hypothetical protein
VHNRALLHEGHLRAAGAIGVQLMPGRLDMITVVVQQDRGGADEDLS